MEQQTKQCPYCGEEIAATAKKCRFCGEWLEEAGKTEEPKASVKPEKRKGFYMRTCPECGKMVPSNAGICPHCKKKMENKICPVCGTVNDPYKIHCEVCDTNFYPEGKSSFDLRDTEEGKLLREMVREKKREKQEDVAQAGAVVGRLLWEVIIVSILWGIMDDWSWWAYPLAIACGFVLIYLGTFFRSILIIGMSILWGLVGAALLMWAFTGFNDALASMWIVLDSGTYIIEAIVIFLISLYIHRRGFKSMEFVSEG